MRRCITIRKAMLLAVWLTAAGVWGQSNGEWRNIKYVERGDSLWNQEPTTIDASSSASEKRCVTPATAAVLPSLHESVKADSATYMIMPAARPFRPYYSNYAGWSGWHGFGSPFYGPFGMIHNGLNASLTAGVSVGFGKHNPWKGAMFFTGASALYAVPLSDRWTVGIGADYMHYSGLGMNLNTLGLFGMANYRINERLDFTGFLSHDFGVLGDGRQQMMNRMPYMPGFTNPCTTIGGELGIKVGESTKISVGVSFTKEENPYGMPSREQR